MEVKNLREYELQLLFRQARFYISNAILLKQFAPEHEKIAREKGYGAFIDGCVGAGTSLFDLVTKKISKELMASITNLVEIDSEGVGAGRYYGIAGLSVIVAEAAPSILPQQFFITPRILEIMPAVIYEKGEPKPVDSSSAEWARKRDGVVRG